jgi:hypothetical protein
VLQTQENASCNHLQAFPTNIDLCNPGDGILHQTRTGSG